MTSGEKFVIGSLIWGAVTVILALIVNVGIINHHNHQLELKQAELGYNPKSITCILK